MVHLFISFQYLLNFSKIGLFYLILKCLVIKMMAELQIKEPVNGQIPKDSSDKFHM